LPLRILVADDNRDVADTIATILRWKGNNVQMVHDGEEALAVATEFQPDVALLDLGMPKINGYDACRRLREQPWGRKLIIIALTGWGRDEDRQRTRDAGFDHHLVKPVRPAALIKLIAELTGKGESGAETAQRG
jgi:CheY-like chemotaxis protein